MAKVSKSDFRVVLFNMDLSADAFRARKRKELRKLYKAMDDFKLGCMGVPGGSKQSDKIEKAIAKLEQNMTSDEWDAL